MYIICSKYRNVLGANVPREEWYEELQLDADRLDLYPIDATATQLAFPSQLNGTSCCVWSYEDAAASTRVVGLAFHPSASGVLAVAMSKHVEVLDVQHQQKCVSTSSFVHPDVITGFTWNDDGSAVATVCQDNVIRLWDPRRSVSAGFDVASTKGHQGRKAAAITWVHPSSFLTAGFNTLQERELMLWDVRKLDKAMARERMDTGTGLLMPIFDQDTNLLFVGGRGDKTIRTYELNVEKARAFTALQPATAGRPTWGMATLPKRACALGKCEVARVLVLEQGGTIEPISYTVPRRDAATQFQVYLLGRLIDDLYCAFDPNLDL
ncbi:hypothetical protein DYB30_008095 [Aphanomyces astaci]|uniref:Coronin n=1 Tax=Aphanomyces astaci TaxID=112090 RepID=A0A397DV88_APHAT|nr:hypothetical protein DYB30_008095 [Aphanomyces astaci]